MSDFLSRATRYAVEVPLTLHVDDDFLQGVTVNVSESGLLATFRQPLAIWSVGVVSMEVGEMMLSIHARVAREEGGSYGLSFQVRNDGDRSTVRYLVDWASGRVL